MIPSGDGEIFCVYVSVCYGEEVFVFIFIFTPCPHLQADVISVETTCINTASTESAKCSPIYNCSNTTRNHTEIKTKLLKVFTGAETSSQSSEIP